MSLFSLKAKAAQPTAVIVSDLDALIAEPIAFRLQGEVHEIKPVSTVELLKFTNAFARLQALNESSGTLSVADLVDAYTQVISSVCPTITRAHVEGMTQSQIAALFQLVIESVMGKAHVAPSVETADDKKKV